MKKSDLIHKLEILEQGLRKLRLRATRESAPPADTLLQAFDETQALLEELRFAEEDQPPRRKKPAAGESATTEYGCTGEELAGQAVILKSMGDGIVVTGIEGKIQYVNPAFERMSGYALPELRGLNGRDLIDGLDEGLFHKTRKALPSGEAVGNSFQIQKKDGSCFDAEVTVTPVANPSGMAQSYVATIRDITERRRVETALKYRLRFEKLISTISSDFINLSSDRIDQGIQEALGAIGQFVEVDRSYLFLFADGRKQMSVTHEWCREGIKPNREQIKGISINTRPWWMDKLNQYENFNIPRVANLPAGTEAENATVYRADAQSLIVVPMVCRGFSFGFLCLESVLAKKPWPEDIVTLLKITGEIFSNALERKRAEDELLRAHDELERRVAARTVELTAANEVLKLEIESRTRAEEKLIDYQQQLRSLASELTLTEERERRRIAEKLHDGIAQPLAFAKIKLGTVCEAASSPEMTNSLGEIRERIEETIRRTRTLTFELSPPVLYELGFNAAVEWLTERIAEEHGLRTEFKDDGQVLEMEEDARVILFQATRELLANVVKHARAEWARVALYRKDNGVYVEVEDNGVGFDGAAVGLHSGGSSVFGLFNIRERLDLFGGTVNVDARPGQGSRVVLALPRQSMKCGSEEE